MNTENKEYRLRLTTDLLGASPLDKEVYTTYIESRAPANNNDKSEAEDVPQAEEKGMTGFLRDEQGLFIYEYVIKGFLKAAGTALKEQIGVKNIKSKIDQFVFVTPRKIYLGKKAADGVFERPLRAQTMQGPRVTLASSEVLHAGVEIGFTLTLIHNKDITMQHIDEMFGYGRFSGLGQFRNGGFGRFEVIQTPADFRPEIQEGKKSGRPKKEAA